MNKWPVHCTVLDGLTGYCVVVIGQDILLLFPLRNLDGYRLRQPAQLCEGVTRNKH